MQTTTLTEHTSFYRSLVVSVADDRFFNLALKRWVCVSYSYLHRSVFVCCIVDAAQFQRKSLWMTFYAISASAVMSCSPSVIPTTQKLWESCVNTGLCLLSAEQVCFFHCFLFGFQPHSSSLLFKTCLIMDGASRKLSKTTSPPFSMIYSHNQIEPIQCGVIEHVSFIYNFLIYFLN